MLSLQSSCPSSSISLSYLWNLTLSLVTLHIMVFIFSSSFILSAQPKNILFTHVLLDWFVHPICDLACQYELTPSLVPLDECHVAYQLTLSLLSLARNLKRDTHSILSAQPTVCNILFRIAWNLLATRIIIKMLTHPC